MDYSFFAIVLLALGLGLLVAELFIPSGGIIFILSTASLVASVWCAYQEWWNDSQGVFWGFIVMLVILLPSAVVGAFTIMPKTEWGRRILLAGPDLKDVTVFAEEANHLQDMIGRTGQTATALVPGGFAIIDGERLECTSAGRMIEKDQPVKVVDVRGFRVVVRPYDPSRQPVDDERLVAEEDEVHGFDDDTRNRPLDFDMPEG